MSDTIRQDTGIRDSIGRKVYEGDIVICGQDTESRYVMTFIKDDNIYLAKQPHTLGSYIGPGYWGDSLLVVGSIYDTPELLEDHSK